MPKKALDLYFHSPCFDGIVSAVMCWDFHERQRGTTSVRLHPVGYDIRDQWVSGRLSENSAVVDFLFHPDAGFWADHHETTFLTSHDQLRYAELRKPDWIHKPRARSCAGMLRTHLRRRYGYRNVRYDVLVNWADRIDSAIYKDVREAVLAPTPALEISLTLAGASSDYCVWLVRQLKDAGLTAVARTRVVQRRSKEAKAAIKNGLELFEKSARLEGDIVLFDVNVGRELVSRYAPYFFFPKARYSVGLMRSEHSTKITAMRNPWRRFESAPIGTIFARHGGGGHRRVGSLILKGDDERLAGKVLEDLVAEIRQYDRVGGRAPV